jgi:ion channel-forming bestrophin family protein
MFQGNNRVWFNKAFNFKSSVLPKILLRLSIITLFFILITYIHMNIRNISFPILGSIVPNVILGLLLVFRTNTAYERFWEGRKLWGDINNNIRSIALELNAFNITQEEKIQLGNRLIRFAYLSKDKFRDDLQTDQLLFEQKTKVHPNLWELNLLNKEIHALYMADRLDQIVYASLNNRINNLINAIGGCERIISTPIPIGYSIHIKQLILLYTITLPFQFVAQTGLFTPLVCFIIGFALMGIEEIGLQIENPFGLDVYDIKLDKICENIEKNVHDLIY